VRPDAAFVEACERELPAGGILRAMLPLVVREWEQWARLGTTPPTDGLLPPDGVPPPGEVAATAAELADVAFLEAAADGAVEAAELAREADDGARRSSPEVLAEIPHPSGGSVADQWCWMAITSELVMGG
jgi:hypothetical protein